MDVSCCKEAEVRVQAHADVERWEDEARKFQRDAEALTIRDSGPTLQRGG